MQARRPVIVKGPYPTVEEIAKDMGVSQSRMREVIRIADAVFDRNERKRTQRSVKARKKQT